MNLQPLMKTKILTRHSQNPLITPQDVEGLKAVFNPSPVYFKGQTILLLSMIFFDHKFGGETRVARSNDGINFTIDDSTFIDLKPYGYPFDTIYKHVIDNRVTKIDNTYYILTPVGNDKFSAPCTVLGKTMDFKKYEVIDVINLPINRGSSLFPEKINGKYFKIDRPGAGTGISYPFGGDLWISSSYDMIHWGQYRPLIEANFKWGQEKIGPTPPIKTSEGWLVITHGVNPGGDVGVYRIGAILLDLENPCLIKGFTKEALLEPEMEYEKNGCVSEVVFPCGAIADENKDQFKLYYGGADSNICLAEGRLSEIVEACKH